MIKHYITKYKSDGKRLATSWIQLNLFGKAFCFNTKTIELGQLLFTSNKKIKKQVY